ncbi:MAG: ferrous iron transport protein A [Chloroflexi bacterium]|nr:ferrous iron transport protein A [Chloroflexota bacterium]
MSAIAEPRTTLMLSMVDPQQNVRLVEIRGGRRLRKRLADLGLTLGATLRVVQAHGCGPMIVAVKHDSRMAIGRGIAHKLIVTPDLAADDPHIPLT